METQKNKELEASKYAYDTLVNAFELLAIKNQLDENTIIAFKKVLLNIYLEKKATNFVENKLDTINTYLEELANNALSGGNKEEEPTNLFIYRTKKLVSYE